MKKKAIFEKLSLDKFSKAELTKMSSTLGGAIDKKTKDKGEPQATEPAGALCSPDEKTVTVIRYND